MLYNPAGHVTLLSGLEVLKALALTSCDTVLSLTLDHVTGLTVTIAVLTITETSYVI